MSNNRLIIAFMESLLYIAVIIVINWSLDLFIKVNNMYIQQIALRSLCIMLVSFISLYFIGGNKIDLYIFAFIIMLFCGHFGQIWYLAYFTDSELIHGFVNVLPNFLQEDIIKACNFSMIIIVLIITGILFIASLYNKNMTFKTITDTNIIKYKWVGLIFILLFFPFQLYILHLRVHEFYISGYSLSLAVMLQTPGVVSALGNLSMTGIALLLMVCQRSVIKQCIYFFIIVCYFGFFMTIGWRNTAFTNSIVLGIIFIFTVRLSSFKKILIVIFLLGITILALNISRVIRSGMSMTLSPNGIIKIIPLVLMEFGTALYPVVEAVRTVGSTREEWLGVGYIIHILTIFPNIFGILNGLTYYMVEHFLCITGKGGSIIAEIYCNFINVGYLFAPFLGITMGWLSYQFKKAILENNLFIIALLYPVMVSSLFWVRNSINPIYRAFFWNLIALLFIVCLVKSFGKYRRYL